MSEKESERERERTGDFAFRRGTLFTSACEFALRKGLQVIPARARRGALTRLQKMSTLSLRCALSPAARASKHALASAYTRECVRAEGFVVRAGTQSGHLEFTFKRYDREEGGEGGGGDGRERETLRLVAPACGNTRKPITQPAPGSLEADSLHAIPCKRGAPLRAA